MNAVIATAQHNWDIFFWILRSDTNDNRPYITIYRVVHDQLTSTRERAG